MRPSSLRPRKLVLICILVSILAPACATFQERPAATPAANLVITPNSGVPETKIAIMGSGFIPGETIEVIIVVDGVPTELGEKPMVKKANEMGAFMTTSNIPRMASPGVYAVKASGDKGTVAVAPLNVEEKPKKK